MDVVIRTLSKRDYAMKDASPNHFRGHRRGRTCAQAGCNKTTRQGKPYCTDHVLQNDYAGLVSKRFVDHEAEIQRIEKRGASAVDLDGVFVLSVLNHLRGIEVTRRKLTKDFSVSLKVIDAVVNKLRRHGLVQSHYSKRGTEFVKAK